MIFYYFVILSDNPLLIHMIILKSITIKIILISLVFRIRENKNTNIIILIVTLILAFIVNTNLSVFLQFLIKKYDENKYKNFIKIKKIRQNLINTLL